MSALRQEPNLEWLERPVLGDTRRLTQRARRLRRRANWLAVLAVLLCLGYVLS